MVRKPDSNDDSFAGGFTRYIQPRGISIKRFALLGSVSLILSAAALQAQSSGRTCSNQTLRGAYGVLFTGTAAAASVLPGLTGTPGSIEQTTGVVIHTFDGFGQFTQTDTVKGSL